MGWRPQGVGGAAPAVAYQRLGRAGWGLRDDLFLQLGEQPLLQPPVVLEGSNLIGLAGGEFGGQRFGVPGLQVQAGAALDDKRGGARQGDQHAPIGVIAAGV